MKRENSYFSSRFANWLKSQNKSESEIAKLLGVSQSSLSNYKNGRVPEWWILAKIASLWGETVDQILGLPSPKEKKLTWLKAVNDLRPILDGLGEEDSADVAESIGMCLKLKGLRPPGRSKPKRRPARAQKR